MLLTRHPNLQSYPSDTLRVKVALAALEDLTRKELIAVGKPIL